MSEIIDKAKALVSTYEQVLKHTRAERDQLRAELAAAKANVSLVGAWEQAARKAAAEDGVQFVGPNTIFAASDKLRAERDQLAAHVERIVGALNRAYEQAARQLAEPRNHGNDQFVLTDIATMCELALAATPAQSLEAVTAPLMAHVERLVEALGFYAKPEHWMAQSEHWEEDRCLIANGRNRVLGHGWEEAKAALAATPAQSIAAHDAASKEPSPFLSRAAWRVVKEVWVDVAAGRMNARSAVADAALDLRGLLEESGPEPADDVVGVERKAKTTFGGYLAAHDAALLRRTVNKITAWQVNRLQHLGRQATLAETMAEFVDEADRIERDGGAKEGA